MAMKRLVLVAATYAALISTAGWFRGVQAEADDDKMRMERLIYESEDMRNIREEWRRFWYGDSPSHLPPERVHGCIEPG